MTTIPVQPNAPSDAGAAQQTIEQIGRAIGNALRSRDASSSGYSGAKPQQAFPDQGQAFGDDGVPATGDDS